MDNIVYFQQIRQEKEKQLTHFIIEHIELFKKYVDRQVNIREKVKAKHIFSEKVGCIKSPVFTKMEEQLFLDWFTFDYMTIKGKTVYQSFLDQTISKEHPLNQVVFALFMASVLEPFKVIKAEDKHIIAKKLLTGESFKLHLLRIDQCIERVKAEDIIFSRTIPVFDQLLCVSGLFIQSDHKLIDGMLEHYSTDSDSWRTFLKKFAVKYSWSNQTFEDI